MVARGAPTARARHIVVTMQVTIVRHARAISKRQWSGPDHLRPLDEIGQRHALKLVDTLAVTPIRRLLSSPALRCRQTLEPLARRTGLPIETAELLAAHGDARAVLAGLDRDVLANAVLCTHGEVMRPLLRQLRRRQVVIVGEAGARGWLLRKGVVWHLEIGEDGKVTKLHAVPPSP